MIGDPHHVRPPLEWLVEWLQEAGRHTQCHSLVLAATTGTAPQEVACAVAAYLNEFDGHGGSHWRTFDSTLLEELAGDPISRSLVLSSTSGAAEEIDDSPDLQGVARRLAALGGVILIGSHGSQATYDLETTFHIYLCPDEPPSHRRYHMWVNPVRFTPESLVCVIADSFLDWTCHPSPPALSTMHEGRDPDPAGVGPTW